MNIINESLYIAYRLSKKYISSEDPRHIPLRVQIESTSKCNLRCLECPHSREKGAGNHLTVDGLKQILDWLPFKLRNITLSGVGEPLLNPHFFSLVDILAERDIACDFYSNGTLISSTMSEAILQRDNITGISISCDSAEQNVFEKFRVGADFERWMMNISDFLTNRRDQRHDIRTKMLTVINKENITSLQDIVHMAADLGFHSSRFLDPIPIDEQAAAYIPSNSEISSINFKKMHKTGNSIGVDVTWMIRRDRVPPRAIPRCMQPWQYIFVRADGNIQPCCAVFGKDKAGIMGNVHRDTFSDVWNGKPFREFRKRSVDGTNPLCRICPMY